MTARWFSWKFFVGVNLITCAINMLVVARHLVTGAYSYAGVQLLAALFAAGAMWTATLSARKMEMMEEEHAEKMKMLTAQTAHLNMINEKIKEAATVQMDSMEFPQSRH